MIFLLWISKYIFLHKHDFVLLSYFCPLLYSRFCTISEIPGRRWKNNTAHRSSLCCVYLMMDHSLGLNLKMTFLIPDKAARPCFHAGWPGMLFWSHYLCPWSQMWCLGVRFSNSWIILLLYCLHCVLRVFDDCYPPPSVERTCCSPTPHMLKGGKRWGMF